jgi:hypothetical protein
MSMRSGIGSADPVSIDFSGARKRKKLPCVDVSDR